jgi:hypothetical protein
MSIEKSNDLIGNQIRDLEGLRSSIQSLQENVLIVFQLYYFPSKLFLINRTFRCRTVSTDSCMK